MTPSDQTVAPLPRTPTRLLARLAAMMFLQSWPLGCWGVTVGAYIAANTGETGAGLFSSGFIGYSTIAAAIGSVVSPFVAGLISDRLFSARAMLSATHLGCAGAAMGLYACDSQATFFFWLLVYFHCYFPTATLCNKIGLAHLRDSDVEYPILRLYGALGWISAGVSVGLAWPWAFGGSIEATRTPFMLGALSGLAMALYATTLPPDAPRRLETSPLRAFSREAIDLLSNRPLALFLLTVLLACVPSMAYNNFCNPFLNNQGYSWPAALMTVGQLSEVAILAAMPWIVRGVTLRALFAVGLLSWAVRYGLLAFGAAEGLSWPVYLAIALHGPCFAFIYVIGPLLTDRFVSPSNRGAAQGLFCVVSTGVAGLIGALVVGFCQDVYLTPQGVSPPPYNWTGFWIVPGVISAAAIFGLAFAATIERRKRAIPRGSAPSD